MSDTQHASRHTLLRVDLDTFQRAARRDYRKRRSEEIMQEMRKRARMARAARINDVQDEQDEQDTAQDTDNA